MPIENAVVKNIRLVKDHGCLSIWLDLDYGGSGQGFGGYVLDEPVKDADGKFIRRRGTAYGTEWILRLMDLFGVDDFSKIVGQSCRVYREEPRGSIMRIGHFLKDKWFDPAELDTCRGCCALRLNSYLQ